MAHGGTNFGFYNGANAAADGSDYKPDLTSYDYVRKINLFVLLFQNLIIPFCFWFILCCKTSGLIFRMHPYRNLGMWTMQSSKVWFEIVSLY